MRAGVETLAAKIADRRWVLFTLLLLVYVPTASYGSASIDVVAAEVPAWSVATRGTLNLNFGPHPDLPWFFEHSDGLYSDRFPGAIAFLVPGYWLANLLGVHGFSLLPGAITAAVVTSFGVLVLREVYLLTLRTRSAAHVATLFTAFGTGAWSVCANAPWSHSLNFLLLALGLWALALDRSASAGVAFGGVVLTRPHWAVALGVVGVALSWLRRSPIPAAKMAIGMLPGVLLLFTYNGLPFDRWGPSNGHELSGSIEMRWFLLPANAFGAVLSPTRGLLFFYPIILVCAIAMPRVFAGAASWAKAAAMGAAVGIFVQLLFNRYSGGDTFFGPRLWIEPLVLSAPILAIAAERYVEDNPNSKVVPLMLLAGVLIHATGAILTPY